MNNSEQPARITARAARVVASMTPDAAEIIAPLCIENDAAVSPILAAWVTGRGAKAIRSAVDRGDLPTIGSGSHRFICLSALGRWTHNPVTAAAVAAAFRRTMSDCTLHERLRDAPLRDPPDLDVPLNFDPNAPRPVILPPHGGPEALAGAVHRALEAGRAAAAWERKR